MAATPAPLHLEPGEPTLGLWCPTCMLPSGYEVRVYAFSASRCGLIGTIRRCHDCGTPI
ncbi:hypothetical protein DSM43518_04787 [Mycobacterium marinum]|nr:hypothetical protein CCUG20998_03849 [Mycobacterium marinum]RFZ02800.1 hypothetical protein DSM43518_04787 [Mycobacterium marinum]RFZ25991.1 hypothetical protein DSM43519_01305 [Mycobacterium marinum]RFZ28870.1 hypothetical protein DSM44344_01137 [Mycobacterium marinum]RFZ39056.1 hypothetical protein NCTC2275_00324 [Mycobacterium marinum]